MNVRFIVDENSLALDGLNIDELLIVIDNFLDAIDDALKCKNGVCYDEELFARFVIQERTFWDLFDDSLPIHLPRDVKERAASLFGQMPRWYDISHVVPEGCVVSIDGGPDETTMSVAWAHRQVQGAGLDSVACIYATGRRKSGINHVRLSGDEQAIFFVSNSCEMQHYFRWLISVYAENHHQMAVLAPSAFANLDFVDGCFSGISSMSKPFRNLAPVIVEHLSAFSDHGERIFSGDRRKAPQMFGSLGVNISDENGNTKRNHVAKAERTRVFANCERLFWWHSKLERHSDRIHICPDDVATRGRIIVGIFCKHLTI